MTTVLVVLLLFLLAFTGMALGLLMGRKGLKGGCGGGSTKNTCKTDACHCSGSSRVQQ